MLVTFKVFQKPFKVRSSDLGIKILQKYFKKYIILYSQSLLIFINKKLVVENHPTTREIKRLTTAHVDTDGYLGLFLHEQLAHLHTGITHMKLQL